MIHGIKIVELVFQLLNFIVIIGLIGFLFKKYILNGIRAQMRAHESVVVSLKKSFHMLTRNYQLLDREIEHERQMQYELKQKVMRWRADVEQLHEQMTHERNERSKELKVQTEQQIKEIQKHMLYQEALPRALKKARIQLAKQFEDEKAQKEYLHHTLRDLRQKRGA